MPTPLLHSAVGIACVRAGLRGPVPWSALALGAVVAVLPDLDLLPGMLLGDPVRFHHGMTHSFLFAALSAWLASRLYGGGESPRRLLGSLWVAAFSHSGLDLFNYRATAPLVDPEATQLLLWPLGVKVPPLGRVFESAPIPPDPALWFSSAFFGIVGAELVLSALVLFLAWRLPLPAREPVPLETRVGADP